MEMNQIRCFLAVSKELHFTRAAVACKVSQPALTKAIHKLEEELGGALFLRERSSTRLTDLGRLMLPLLDSAWAAARDAKHQAEAFGRRATSPLRIGIEVSISAALLSPALNALSRHFADVDLSLSEDGQSDLCAAMLAGEIDVAVLVETATMNARLHRWPLFGERYVVAFPDHHRFARQAAVDLRDLQSECLLLMRHRDCPARHRLQDLFRRGDIRPRREHLVANQEQMMELMLGSFGVGFTGERMPLAASITTRPLQPDPGPRQIMLAVAAGRPLGPTPGLFVKQMRARAWAPAVTRALETAE